MFLKKSNTGGSSVHFHMLNMESRKYFNRAYSSSGSALNFFVLRKENHIKQVQMCAQTNELSQMLEYLKTTNDTILAHCCTSDGPGCGHYPIWTPTIENTSTTGAFLTKTPEEIYNSDLSLTMDAMFSINSQVIR